MDISTVETHETIYTFKTKDKREAMLWICAKEMSLALWNIRQIILKDAQEDEPDIPDDIFERISYAIKDYDDLID